MTLKNFVGIDVSKLTLDVFIHEKQVHKQFRNEENGFVLLIQWLEKQTGQSHDSMLICFEHTGLYSLLLANFLEEKQISFSMVPALEIKRSLGVARGKNDIVDSKRIAEYANRFRDKISLTKLPAKDIGKIHSLLTLRDRLSRHLGMYKLTKDETIRVINKNDLPELFSSYENIIPFIKLEISRIEVAIRNIINSNEELRTSFKLITTIKGIGLIVAAYLIVYTHNFTRFDNWRKFACYSGIAPFDFQSGTSVRGRTRVSSIANKQVKKMLHLAAICAMHTDTELREYYHRRQVEGKTKMSTINIIRNKLIARAFAVVRRGTPYVDIKRYVA
ncbi:MAG: IS110 family transposase [Prolixibacteraceae bacterium]|nr:IS110 family transposase [Prolixibacteraceae bacterium]